MTCACDVLLANTHLFIN